MLDQDVSDSAESQQNECLTPAFSSSRICRSGGSLDDQQTPAADHNCDIVNASYY